MQLSYPIQASLYQGANNGNNYPEIRVSGPVVLNLVHKIPEDKYSLYFVNIFTSISWLVQGPSDPTGFKWLLLSSSGTEEEAYGFLSSGY